MLVGDSAFSLSRILMKPYPFSDEMDEKKKHFNLKLSSARRVVENAFGHLKARFRKVGKGLEVKITNCSTIIKACCVLHNFLNLHNDALNQKWVQDLRRAESIERREQPVCRNQQQTLEGQQIRDAIADHLWNERQSCEYLCISLFITSN